MKLEQDEGAILTVCSFLRDVVAFVKSGTKPRIGVISDNVSEPLTDFMRLLVTEYAEIDFGASHPCSSFSAFLSSRETVANSLALVHSRHQVRLRLQRLRFLDQSRRSSSLSRRRRVQRHQHPHAQLLRYDEPARVLF